jgi:hypothetical protein
MMFEVTMCALKLFYDDEIRGPREQGAEWVTDPIRAAYLVEHKLARAVTESEKRGQGASADKRDRGPVADKSGRGDTLLW